MKKNAVITPIKGDYDVVSREEAIKRARARLAAHEQKKEETKKKSKKSK